MYDHYHANYQQWNLKQGASMTPMQQAANPWDAKQVKPALIEGLFVGKLRRIARQVI